MPSPRSGSPPGKIEVAVPTDSYSVTATTPGTGSSMASMIVVLTGTFATCLLSAVSGGRFFLAADFFALMPARWTLDFAFFGVACFAAILRAGLVLALPRFKLFLRAATRFFALPMAISCKACRRHGHLNTSELMLPYVQPIRHSACTWILWAKRKAFLVLSLTGHGTKLCSSLSRHGRRNEVHQHGCVGWREGPAGMETGKIGGRFSRNNSNWKAG